MGSSNWCSYEFKLAPLNCTQPWPLGIGYVRESVYILIHIEIKNVAFDFRLNYVTVVFRYLTRKERIVLKSHPDFVNPTFAFWKYRTISKFFGFNVLIVCNLQLNNPLI